MFYYAKKVFNNYKEIYKRAVETLYSLKDLEFNVLKLCKIDNLYERIEKYHETNESYNK